MKNAIDFVPEKTGSIEINAQASDSQVLFYVKDMAVAFQERNKESFQEILSNRYFS